MKKKVPLLESITGKDLMKLPVVPLEFTVAEILPHGLFILAGAPKVGKSWLALDICHAVATGGMLWDYPAEQGDALYMALEDNPVRLQERLSKVSSGGKRCAATDIHFVTKSAKLGEGLAEQLAAFLDTHPKTRLIVIDTMQYVRNTANFSGTYSGDYHDMDAIREIISKHKLTLLLITHTRKAKDKDPINLVSGSTGLIGAVDGVFVLKKHNRSGSSAKLIIANRDTESHLFELCFDKASCRWQFLSEASDDDDGGEDDNYLFTALDCLLDKSPLWSGTATELCAALSRLDSEFKGSPTVITKALKTQAGILQSQYGIISSFSRSKSARIIKLARVAGAAAQEKSA
jgi:hypothetical protein